MDGMMMVEKPAEICSGSDIIVSYKHIKSLLQQAEKLIMLGEDTQDFVEAVKTDTNSSSCEREFNHFKRLAKCVGEFGGKYPESINK